MWRGYDSGVVLREDKIERIEHLYAEIAEIQARIKVR